MPVLRPRPRTQREIVTEPQSNRNLRRNEFSTGINNQMRTRDLRGNARRYASSPLPKPFKSAHNLAKPKPLSKPSPVITSAPQVTMSPEEQRALARRRKLAAQGMAYTL